MSGAKFIWTDEKDYIYSRKTVFDGSAAFRVCAFKKSFSFDRPVRSASVKIFADSKYFLYVNHSFIGSGPVCAGGDANFTGVMPVQYFSVYDLGKIQGNLDVFVYVQLGPVLSKDSSLGRGGLFFEGEISFEDGTSEQIVSDESWLCSPVWGFSEDNVYDYDENKLSFKNATEIENIWNLKISPIPVLTREKKYDIGVFLPLSVPSKKTKKISLNYDKVYLSNLYLDIYAPGSFEITAKMGDSEGKILREETIKGSGHVIHQGFVETPVSFVELFVDNHSNGDAVLYDAAIIYSHYPTAGENGSFFSSDKELNKLYELSVSSLEMCRNTIHYESPYNQSTLSFARDYYIEALMGYLSFADTRLIRFDIMRIADYLSVSNGEMASLESGLLWVLMLYDYYMRTGDIWTLEYSSDALKALNEKMAALSGEEGVIAFKDSSYKGESSVLNAFYYKALRVSEDIYKILGESELAALSRVKSLEIKTIFNKTFFDDERGLYFERKADADERSFSKKANVLSVLYGIADNKISKDILLRSLYEEEGEEVPLYFMHFVFEALYKEGLFEEYGLSEMKRWESLLNEDKKAQGFGASRISPMYHLPQKISGLEILEPGMKKVKFSPNLFSLERADIKIPTPYGTIEIEIGSEVNITAPTEIEVVV